eukprot:Plantae.Rhodophyta-Hildenbrandia_rubra.ctg13751.p1 GENE.Plantae.Rhodophyta-Hildenbrandia_rubra.ctg13751~~Plantae.Rhodophyta-Hildenbrandia_rubra.ctg13751.p1  ORF type:complete len:422 (-),score=63.91 Plantae.Rhodophyta-Hildenbrandia_rubra.ctg13751:618-1883(-)
MPPSFIAGWTPSPVFPSRCPQRQPDAGGNWRCSTDNTTSQTPLSGSIYSGRVRRGLRGIFFEGWYFRVTLADAAFAFMYSIEEDVIGNKKGVVQVLGPDSVGIRKELLDGGDGYWGEEQFLSVGHWKGAGSVERRRRRIGTKIFDEGRRENLEGYQLTGVGSMGRALVLENECEWNISFQALDGWGSRGEKQKCTGTWIGYLPVFEPGWQVLLGHGKGWGYVEWKGKRWEFKDAAVYAEKNWGKGFPEKWWWLQSNRWDGEGDLAVTAAGGLRGIWPRGSEEVGLLAVHYRGEFYEFGNWCCDELSWNVKPWGRWEARARSESGYRVRIVAETSDTGHYFNGPSTDGKLPEVRDAPYGQAQLWLYDPNGKAMLNGISSKVAQVEVGGGPWNEDWNVTCRLLPAPLRNFINAFNGPKAATSL